MRLAGTAFLFAEFGEAAALSPVLNGVINTPNLDGLPINAVHGDVRRE